MLEKSTFQKSTNRIESKSVPAQRVGKKGVSLAPPIQRKPNLTGLPDQLKTGIENLSGHSMDDVKVHYNSSKPAQLQAHAYAQGNQIHLAPGQEKHLPHEAWHVVQQKQGRVKPTIQFQHKININDDAGLEKEADMMGEKAMGFKSTTGSVNNRKLIIASLTNQPVQKVKSIQVNKSISQELIDPGKDSATSYQWESKFTIYIYGLHEKEERPKVLVYIRIETAADDSVVQEWSRQVQGEWSNKFAIKDEGIIFPIEVQLVRSEKKAYTNYTIENVKQSKSHGVRGLFGTESMTKWGEEDPQDIPHEVGHMLGNKDEYGTVDGHDWEAEYNELNAETHSIMHKGGQPPRVRHFNLICTEIAGSGLMKDPTIIKMSGSHGLKTAASSSSSKLKASVEDPYMSELKAKIMKREVSKETVASSSHETSSSSSLAIASKEETPSRSTGKKKVPNHDERVKLIENYAIDNIDQISAEQVKYLKSLNWSESEEGSLQAYNWIWRQHE
jgi:hypothetical protein